MTEMDRSPADRPPDPWTGRRARAQAPRQRVLALTRIRSPTARCRSARLSVDRARPGRRPRRTVPARPDRGDPRSSVDARDLITTDSEKHMTAHEPEFANRWA